MYLFWEREDSERAKQRKSSTLCVTTDFSPLTHQACALICMITMMTSSNGNIFRVTGPLCGEFTGPGEFPTQRPVTLSFDVFFGLCLNKRLSKQPCGWWFETPSWSLWRHCNDSPTSEYNWRRCHANWICSRQIFFMCSQENSRCFGLYWKKIKYQSSAPLAFVIGIQRWPVNSPHKRAVMRKVFSFDDVIMNHNWLPRLLMPWRPTYLGDLQQCYWRLTINSNCLPSLYFKLKLHASSRCWKMTECVHLYIFLASLSLYPLPLDRVYFKHNWRDTIV